jgi:hypothetical protein
MSRPNEDVRGLHQNGAKKLVTNLVHISIKNGSKP